MKKLVLPSLFIVSLILLAPAVLGDTAVCRWQGNISIGGNLLLGNLTGNSSFVVSAKTDSTLETFGKTFNSGTPIYYINVPGNDSSSNITFYVCGIYDQNAGEVSWDCSSGQNALNLQMTWLASGTACSYDCACNQSAGLHCASDYDGAGSWCAAQNTCMHDGSSTANAGTVTVGSTLYTCTNGAWESSTVTTGTTGGGGVTGAGLVSESRLAGSGSAGDVLVATYTKHNDLKIQEITVTLKDTVTNSYIKVKESSLPSGANAAISSADGASYKYLEITKTNLADDDIESAVINFKVAKSWITANSIDKSTIALQRYESGSSSWTEYPATILSEDSDYVYYTVEVPGLSIYVITGEKVEAGKLCTAGAKVCVGDDLQQCSSDGLTWEALETCEYGCEAGACKLVVEPVCTAGAKRCYGGNVQQCSADGSAWEALETCEYGCEAGACKAAPVEPEAPDYTLLIIVIVIVIIIVIVAAAYFMTGRKKGSLNYDFTKR